MFSPNNNIYYYFYATSAVLEWMASSSSQSAVDRAGAMLAGIRCCVCWPICILVVVVGGCRNIDHKF